MAEPAAVGELPPHATGSKPNRATVISALNTCHLQSMQPDCRVYKMQDRAIR
jgi:hypothetical protein